MKTLYLLDGHALVYQYHFALRDRPLINSKGVNTSAIVGFTRMLWDLLQNSKPSHIAVVFDPAGPTFRSDLYLEYKANREEQPEDIGIALPEIRAIVEAMEIPVCIVDGYEADDVIGTLACKAEKEGFEVFMVTPDKDYGQLVTRHIHQYRPSRMGSGVTLLKLEDILEKWDIERPEQVIDMLALQGDTSDNIPGVPGIGPKTAAQLLKQFGSLEAMLERADEVKGKNADRLREYADQARLSYKLATIETNAPIDFDATRFTVDPMNKEALAEIFRRLEIRTLARQILGEEASPKLASASGVPDLFSSAAPGQGSLNLGFAEAAESNGALNSMANSQHDYKLVNTDAELQTLLQVLAKASQIALDTETTSTEPHEAELVGVSFSVKPGQGWYVPMPEERAACLEKLEVFRPVLENEQIVKIGQNLKYDAIVLKWHGIDLAGPVEDTMLMHYVLSPELKHNLDYMSETYLRYKPQPIEDLIGPSGKTQKSMRDVEVERVAMYASEDADITLQLFELLKPKLKEEQMHKLYEDVEAPLVYVLRDMECNGVALDVDFLAQYSVELGGMQMDLEKQIYEQAGTSFNINSPAQVGDILFNHLKVPYKGAKTKTGQYKTDEFTMQEVAKLNPVAQQILEYRQLSKLRGTDIDALPKLINPRDGRVHSSFNQAAVATGRLSSSNPNLQNIPMRTEIGRQIRRAFVASDADHCIVSADYSQIELRLIADMAKETAMLEAFNSGQDIHRSTAALVFGVPYDEVTADQRRKAKTVNFGIIYGAGAQRMSQELEIDRREAQGLIDQYFETYQGLKRYMADQVDLARQQGYVSTLLGRRRYLRDINSGNGNLRAYAERNAVNTPIQGTAADLMKLAMIHVQRRIRKEGLSSKLILQVHDELVFEVPRRELDQLRPLVEQEMSGAMPGLQVKLLAESGAGDNWLEAH